MLVILNIQKQNQIQFKRSILPFMKDREDPGFAPAALGEMRTSREDEEFWYDSDEVRLGD